MAEDNTPTNVVDEVSELQDTLRNKYKNELDELHIIKRPFYDPIKEINTQNGIFIEEIILKPEFRGSGIGTEIVDEIKQFATENNYGIELEPVRGENAVIRFWENQDFELQEYFDDKGNLITNDKELNNVYKWTPDTPTNVVDDVPTLNTDLVWREDLGEEVSFPGGNTDQPRWKEGVVKKNNILKPNLRSKELGEIIPQILDGTVSDIDFTRFGIWLMHHSPTPAYGPKSFNSLDALADVTKIVIFNGKSPIDLVNEDTLETMKNYMRLDGVSVDITTGPNAGYKSYDGLSDELILQFGKEEGPFANAQQRMKQTIINEHNKLYANADDYFILFRGGALTDDPVQSFSKDGFQAWSVGLQTNQETIRQGRGIDGYFVNKNDFIDLHSLGLEDRGEVEVIVYKEAVESPWSKTVINPAEGDINYLSKDRLKFIEDNWNITSSELPKEGFVIPDTPPRLSQGPGAAAIDDIAFQNTQLIDNLPVEQVVKDKWDNLVKSRYRNLVTPGGVLDAVDVWEFGVMGLMMLAIAYKEYDEIPTLVKNAQVNMFNNMTSQYGVKPIQMEEYDIDYEFMNTVLETGEKVMPTDILIKKVQEVEVDTDYVSTYLPEGTTDMDKKFDPYQEGVAEVKELTANIKREKVKQDLLESKGIQEEKMFKKKRPKKSAGGGSGVKIL